MTSKDGTRIGYRRLGSGPGVVLLHGSNQHAGSHMSLAQALAGQFTVYLPDRRGRGMSGPYPHDYGVRTEVADLAAVLEHTGARNVFGVSASGIAVLEAARALPGAIDKVVAYEPAILTDGDKHTAWLARFDDEMARGKVASALITSMFGLDLAPFAFKIMPRFLLEAMTEKFMRAEERDSAPGAVTMRQLASTLHYEGVLLAEMEGRVERFSTVESRVLLIRAGKGLKFLHPAIDALAATLPHATVAEFAGLDHGSAADLSPANSGGKPEVVAAELARFFA
ncbi:alpha/beta fold hydrolase [Sinomonas sp. G460-2]|uniref:alpha/beta fold hydrolase n=1 Tax=Sinomonas sp. G460-2 TaxID=3393464 RepID=UPI0039EDF97F